MRPNASTATVAIRLKMGVRAGSTAHCVLIRALPQSAWRLLIDFLLFDRTFCHNVTPLFRPLGFVTLVLTYEAEQEEGR